MNTFTTNVSADRANGSCLQGYIETTYDNIVEHLGAPVWTRGGKTNAQWIVEFEDGLIATLYDWKLNACPKGLYKWHVGGHKGDVVSRLAGVLGAPYMQTPF
jgi:hypothetical protein